MRKAFKIDIFFDVIAMPKKATIYHGSRLIIEKPAFGVGNPRNDYGLGFYCTHDIDLAKEWACTGENSGHANE
jgi:hypothetical protein